ncbi:5348_t:CDS:2 [Funneliformis geosporum]|uniref:5348_t:CDS:1 n=1 Tax=Funneliformis geosporum TaxID=1117311 RepID=A0A9W4T2C7_9GLOM|nr:5348_t:CDS:2 [Funneliformis geosporum]
MDDFSDIDEIDAAASFNTNDKQVDSDNNTVKSEDDTNLSKSEETIAFFSRKTQVKEVYYSTVPIEYPKTSEEGVAITYNITGWTNPRDC